MKNKPVGAGVPDGPQKSLPLEGKVAPEGPDEAAHRQADASNQPAAPRSAPSSASLRSAPAQRNPFPQQSCATGNKNSLSPGQLCPKGEGKPEKGRTWATRFFYPILYALLFVALRVYHWPTLRGREHLPEGACVICANHSGFADALWVFQLLGPKILPWTMAKKSVIDTPVLGPFLRTFRAFPVDRENTDLAAVKKSLSVLKNGEKLLIFPEGTRIKNGKKSEPKSGAALLAQRADVPLVPVYITHGRKPFQPIKVIMGEAYKPSYSCRRPDAAELEEKTAELMAKVYALGK